MTTISYQASDGARQWSRPVVGGLDSSGIDLGVGLDGTVFAIGRLNQGSVGHTDFLTIAYRPSFVSRHLIPIGCLPAGIVSNSRVQRGARSADDHIGAA